MTLIIIGILILIAGICLFGGLINGDFWEGVVIALGVVGFCALLAGGVFLIATGVGIL